jgi:uroporphyrinogen-III decarboxylase
VLKDKDILKPLVDQILNFAADPGMEKRKKMWADHQALQQTEKVLICVWYEFIPEPQWKLMLGRGYLRCRSVLARDIERELRKRLWAAQHVPDDHIVWSTVSVPATVSREVDWGVCFSMSGTDEQVDDPLEAKRYVPAFPDRIEPERLRFSDWLIDEQETARSVEEARKLTDDRLQIAVSYPDLGFSPFDLAAGMRGLEELMLDVYDAPQRVHELMDIITSAFEQHHRNREQRGWLNVVPSSDGRYTQVGFRVHCAHIPSDLDQSKPALRHEWAYISAQTSSGLGPEMFAEFVHPYNVRLARCFSNQTVYYHGCEQLDHKLAVLSTLPNLRRLHVSPWSSIEAAREKFQGSVVLEVHAHPGRVFFGYSREDMKEEVARLVHAAQGVPLDLNLSDIHSVNGDPRLLTQWTEAAQEAAGN